MQQGAPETAAEARGEPYSEPTLTDHALAEEILAAQERIADNESVLHALRIEVQRRIEDSGGTMLPDDEFEMKLEPGRIVDWETNHLIPLKEILTTADLKAIFTKEHDEEVPEQVIPAHTVHHNDAWANGVKLNAMARKYGDGALAHVARAGIRSDPKVVVARK